MTKERGKKEEKKSDAAPDMKKLEAEPPPSPAKKTAPKTFKKLEAMPLHTVPAGIVWVDGAKKPGGPKLEKKSAPSPLSTKLGGHKIGFSPVGLGMPAAGLKSLGGMGGLGGRR